MTSRYPKPAQFINFAMLAVFFANIAFWGWVSWSVTESGDQSGSQLGVFVLGLFLSLSAGWVIWGPFFLFALFPGSIVFIVVRDAVSRLSTVGCLPNIAAAAATAIVSWFCGILLVTLAFEATDWPFPALLLLPFGILAAMLAALIALPKVE